MLWVTRRLLVIAEVKFIGYFVNHANEEVLFI